MKVLDLDMDYFMTEVAYGIAETSSGRLEDDCYIKSVWMADEVVAFIEGNLGISKERKIPGRIVCGHNESLLFWKELISESRMAQ